MINRSVARRYARALLELEEKEPAEASRQLGAFQASLNDNPALADVLTSPAFSHEESGRVLTQIQSRLHIGPLLGRFLMMLAERRRMSYLPAILETFQEMVDAKENRVRVQVESASPVDPPTLDRIQKTLAAALGKEVQVELRSRPELLAGLSLRVGSLLVDGSLRTQLRRLGETLRTRRT